jgi:uncharacterized protein (DUF2141 family)
MSVLIASCAQIVTPTGGKIDSKPPEAIHYQPEKNTIHFNSSSIAISFDEFIQLKDAQKQIVISPPLKNNPDFSVKNKKLYVKFTDTLRTNTTYKINFGNAITDITEGNALSNFSYVFSTGSFIDSLSIKGNLLDAFTLKADENMMVVLYEQNKYKRDSCLYKEMPDYFTNLDKSGHFEITNVKSGNYYLAAYADLNANFMFDEEDEKVAFVDSMIQINGVSNVNYELLSFKSEPKKLFVKNEIQSKYFTRLVFNKITTEKISTRILPSFSDWCIEERSKFSDTITYWYTSETRKLDSISLYVSRLNSKSKQSEELIIIDTIDVNLKKYRANNQASRGNDRNSIKLSFPNLVNQKSIKPSSDLIIACDMPIIKIDTSYIHVKINNENIPFHIHHFTKGDKKLQVSLDTISDSTFTLTMFPSALISVTDATIDSVKVQFNRLKTEDLSSVELAIHALDSIQTYIAIVKNEAGGVELEKVFTSNTTLQLNELLPGKFTCMLICDKNKNGRWDAGSYARKEQAEKVYYLNKDIIAKPNWEIKEEWNLLPVNPTLPK